MSVKFSAYTAELVKITLSSALALGLVFGAFVLVAGKIEGAISFDIDLSAADSIWFLLGTPVILLTLFLIVSPLSYFLYRVVRIKQRGDES
jgi:uncharacterized BrkB/YihY/UPF0761 family membrane protein